VLKQCYYLLIWNNPTTKMVFTQKYRKIRKLKFMGKMSSHKKNWTMCPLILFDTCSMYDQSLYLQDNCMCITKIPVCFCFFAYKISNLLHFWQNQISCAKYPLLKKCTFITENNIINTFKFRLVYLDINSTKTVLLFADMKSSTDKWVRKGSYRKRNTKHTPTSQAKHTHTHTDACIHAAYHASTRLKYT